MAPVGNAGSATSVQQIIEMRNQIIQRSDALQSIHAPSSAVGMVQASAASSFADTLQGLLGTVNASQTHAGEIGDAYQRGEITDVAQVMLARQEAGVAFEATLQVRNKLLSAYQDIMRMGV